MQSEVARRYEKRVEVQVAKAEKSAMLRQRAYDQKLIDKAQVEAVRAELTEVRLLALSSGVGIMKVIKYLDYRLARLKEDGETK